MFVEKSKRRFEQYQDQISRFITARAKTEGLELDIDETTTNNNNSPTLPKTITFQVTDDCNLRCTYCYQINKGKRVMTLETAKKFVDMLIQESYDPDSYVSIETTPTIVIEFIGGEPLLEIDLIDQITSYFRARLIQENHPWTSKILFSMISNGVLYFEPKVQDYIKRNVRHLSFGISLDGCKPLHDMCRIFPDGTGSYDIAEAGCLHYKENYDPDMLTKMTIAPENISWTFEAFQNLIKLGYPIIHANCVYEKGWTVQHATVLYDQLKKIADYLLENDLENDVICTILDEYSCMPEPESENKNYCGSTGCMLTCDPDGIVAPCIRFLKSSLGEEVGDFALGDVDHGLGRTKCHRCNIDTLDAVSRRSQSTDECFYCPISLGCGWCTAYNYQELGTPDARCTYICWMHRARSLANVYYWNKVYRKHNELMGETNQPKYFNLFLPKDIATQIISEDEYNMLYELAGSKDPEEARIEFLERERMTKELEAERDNLIELLKKQEALLEEQEQGEIEDKEDD